MKKFLSLLFLLVFIISIPATWAQSEEEEIVETIEKQQISLSELMQLINEQGNEVFLQDLIISPTPQDAKFLIDKIFYKIYEIPAPSSEASSLYLYNCDFLFEDGNALVFDGWSFLKLNIIGVNADCPIRFSDCNLAASYPIRIENTSFGNDLEFVGDVIEGKLSLNNCQFKRSFKCRQAFSVLQFDGCTFDADSSYFANADSEVNHYQLDISETSFGEVQFTNCELHQAGISNLLSINMSAAEIGKLNLWKLQLHSLDLTDLSVEKSILGDSLQISDYVAVQNFDFPAENTNLPWYNLGGEKLCLLVSDQNARPYPYQAKTNESISNTLLYNELMSCYNKINGMYQARGDRRSTNSSYIEIKNLETRMQRYLYQVDPTLNLFIGYHLNQFLSFFSDYATNPAKSLLISLYTILIFAFIYLLTYSEWDGINFRYFVRQYMLLADYFMTDQSLKDLYKKDIKEEHEQFEKMRAHYLRNKADIPLLVRGLGYPLYFLWTARQTFSLKLYEKIELMHGQWKQLSRRRKTFIGVLTAIMLLVFFIMVLLIKFINSFILSINMFLAMGFGKTPDGRSPMYLTVIEGLIGWLMITIFTITLLSQLLQAW